MKEETINISTSGHAMIRINFWVKSCACWVEIINWICASGHIIPEPDTRLIVYSVQCSHHNMLYSVQCCTRHGEHSSEHRQSVSKKLSWGGQLAGAAPPPAPPTRCQQWGYYMWILSSRTLGQWHQDNMSYITDIHHDRSNYGKTSRL